MKPSKFFLLVVLILNLFGIGCSARDAQNRNAHTQPSDSKQDARVTVVSGLPKEQAESFAYAIKKAQVENTPIVRGRELEEQRRWQDAIKHYEQVLASGKFAREAHAGLARIYEILAEYDKAIEHREQELLLIADWAKPEYQKKLSELKAKNQF